MEQTEKVPLRPWPDFAEKGVIYQLFLRAFTLDGTLKAAEKMLPHLAELGIDIVYLCPPVVADDDMNEDHWSERQKKSGIKNPKNPYRLKDYFHVDPEYGTDQDLKDFVRRAHDLGMKALLDLVYYHCGPTAVFLEEHPNYVKRNEDSSIRYGLWHFPELNFDNPEVRQYLWKNMETFIRDFDFDGFRCDVACNVPLDFWEEGRRRIEAIKPGGILMLSETAGNQEEQREAFDISYGYTPYIIQKLMNGQLTARQYREEQEKSDRERSGNARLIRSTDNHDIANDLYEKRTERVAPFRKNNASLALIFAMEGIPFLYNGQEIADDHRHSLWASREYPGNLGIAWEKALSEEGRTRLEFLRKLIAVRRSSPLLTRGSFEWIDNDCEEDVLTILRRLDGRTMLCAINFSPAEHTVHISTDLPAGAVFRLSDRAEQTGNALKLGEYGIAYLEF